MKPVNLLPAEHRPRRSADGRSGSAYLVLGVLGAVLVAAVLYVLSANQVTEREGDIVTAKRELNDARARAGALEPVAQFLQVKATREASVRSLASGRFDWERLTRELSHVTPEGIYLRSFDGSTDGAGASTAATGTGSTGGRPASGAAAAAAASSVQPQLSVIGCADDQDAVATLLVRYRRLHDVDEVKLQESKDERVGGGSTGGGGNASDGCPALRFTVNVTFDQAQAAAAAQPAERVPASLGGGQ